MIALAAVAGVTLGGCVVGQGGPSQPVGVAAAEFVAAVKGCAAPLEADGTLDRDAIAAAGWRPVEHLVGGQDGVQRPMALDARPRPGSFSYETLVFTRPGTQDSLNLTHYGPLSDDPAPPVTADEPVFAVEPLRDACRTSAAVASEKEVAAVRQRLARTIGAAPVSVGMLPQGGDWLTPRFDAASFGYSWKLPRHDVVLAVEEPSSLFGLEYGNRHVGLTVTAAPTRPPESPEIRRLREKGLL